MSFSQFSPRKFVQKFVRFPARFRRNLSEYRFITYLAVLGPGIIAANAGNDASGIATYSTVGAAYGYSLLWAFLPMTLCLIVAQEMSVRMGVVTGKRQLLPPPVESMEGVWNIYEEEAVMQMLAYSFIGGKEKIKAMMTGFVKETGINEVMATSHIFDHKAKLNSYKLFAEALK